jgi:hypothetical protein
MRFRKLRIAWSVTWGLVAVLLIVMWARSYFACDTLQIYFNSQTFRLDHLQGVMYGRTTLSKNSGPDYWLLDTGQPQRLGKTHIFPTVGGFGAFIPFWCSALLAGMLASVPWLHWRFSLRTLLIATTLVAVALGTIVWMSQKG